MRKKHYDTYLMTDEELFKIKLTGLRHSQKLTQEELAKKAGLSANCVSDIECFKRTNTLDSVIKYLSALGYRLTVEVDPLLSNRWEDENHDEVI